MTFSTYLLHLHSSLGTVLPHDLLEQKAMEIKAVGHIYFYDPDGQQHTAKVLDALVDHIGLKLTLSTEVDITQAHTPFLGLSTKE